MYLGWRLVDGRLVHTATHPAIIEEDTFLLTQQILTEHGRRPTQGVVRSARPQLMSGLLWCLRHDVPLRMTAAGVKGGARYQCDDSYDHGQANHRCTLLDARLPDDPVTDVILRRCQFTEHAKAVLAQL